MAWTAILGAFASIIVCGAALAQPPAEHFARLPAAQGMSLSPDGTRIAFIAQEEGDRILAIINVETGELNRADASALRAFDTFWTSNSTVVASVGQLVRDGRVRGDVDIAAFVTIQADTMQSRPLLPPRLRAADNFNRTQVAGVERSTGRLLMALYDHYDRLSLYAVDPDHRTSQARRATGTEDTRYWVSSPDGDRHVRIVYSDRDRRQIIEIETESGWRSLINTEAALQRYSVVGFTEGGEDLVVSHFQTTAPHRRVLQRLSTEDGSFGDILFSDPRYDYEEALIDPHRGHVAGVSIHRERRETVWFDEELASRQRSLNAAFPNMVVELIDWTPDRNRFIARTESGDRPPAYHLVDFTTGTAHPIQSAYPELQAVALHARRPITYPAQDGVQIPAYLTLPDGEGPHPFIILVHGGPESRDQGGFDYFAHFLASRSYGVIQPQFRGSTGFGRAWRNAGRGGWGRGIMQSDVDDALTYLRDTGLAERACIAGASYGGYSALAGAAFTPDLYDCAISINGVTDLVRQQDYVRDRFGPRSQPARYWNRIISGENTDAIDRDYMRSISPAEFAQNVQIPVLLLHGENDTVVPVHQSRIMRRNLERASAEVEYVELDGGDHWLLEYDTRLEVLQRIEVFLDAVLALSET